MIKFICGFIGLLFFLCRCVQSNEHSTSSPHIRAVHIAGSMPAITPDTSYTISNSYDIFYYDDLIMYKFEYWFDSLLNGKLVMRESRPNFFVFQKDSFFGYSYYPPPNTTTTEGRVSIDTMFKRNAYEPFKFDSEFNHKPDSLYFDEQKNLVKVYTTSVSHEYPEEFTFYLYYSRKLAGLTESFFSKSMDNEKGMKLFRIRILGHGHYYEKYRFALPKRELLYEMKEISIENETEIMSYFDKYKKSVLRGF